MQFSDSSGQKIYILQQGDNFPFVGELSDVTNRN